MTPNQIEAHFTRSDGGYAFARWGRPIAPIVFGVDDKTLSILKGAIEAVAALADHDLAETDPELGSNLMFFFFTDWRELVAVPDLDKIVPDLALLVDRLIEVDANQYRVFRFDDQGGIRACFVFIRMDEHLYDVPAETLALSQAVQSILLWSDDAFRQQSPLALVDSDTAILKPDVSNLIRACYDPTLPNVSDDPSHALRIFARMSKMISN